MTAIHISTDINHLSTDFCTEYWRYLQPPLWSFKGWVGYSQLEETHHGPKDVIEILRTFSAFFSCQWNFPGAFLLWGSVRICEACYIETIWNLQGEGSHVKHSCHSCNAKHIAAQRKEHLRSCHFKMQLLNSAILDPLGENLLNVMATIKLQQPAASGFSLEADTLQLKVLRAMLTWHECAGRSNGFGEHPQNEHTVQIVLTRFTRSNMIQPEYAGIFT